MKKLALALLSLTLALGFAMPVFADDDPPGMMDKHGDIDMMTRPRMQKSCRTPDFYIMRADELGLSDNQLDALGKLDSALKKDMTLKGAAVKVLEMDLSDIVVRPDFKMSDAQSKLKDIEKARTELRTAVIKASSDARDLLAPEQLEKLKEMGIRGAGSGAGCDMTGCDKKGCETKGCMKHGQPGMEGKKQMMMDKMQQEMMKENMPE